MSAPGLLIAASGQNYLTSPTSQIQDTNNNNNNNKMSSASVATNLGLAVAPGGPTDLIESKFNELAKRILDELKQTTQRSEFFQAIDQILSEPAVRRHDHLEVHRKRRVAAQQRQASKDASEQQAQKIELTNVASSLDTEALKRQCDSLAERQRQQQEQLDSHQQILFDSQYRSLPSEITQAVAGHEQRRAQHRAAHAGAALQKSSNQTLRTQKSLDQETRTTARVSKTTRDSANDQPVKQQKLTISNTSPVKTKGGVVSSASSSSINNSASRQRSAIPQSTILSGIASAAYPLAKSATTTAATTVSTTTTSTGNEPAKLEGGLVRQASLKINKQTREAQQEFINRHTVGATMTASEKLRHRRPTKATISGNTPTSDDSDQDEDDDDDDDDYEYQNLASRRAYLNQRFIDQSQQEQQQQQQHHHQQQVQKMQQQPTQVVGKTSSDATSKTTASRQSPNQQQKTINSASQVAKQRQRFSQGGAPIVRSSTIGAGAPTGGGGAGAGGQQQRPAVVSTSRPTSRNRNNNEDQQEPRSLGGLLTSHDIGQLYKPHMNYSTSLLGNHRLSDDDEIIIIPTAQSPSLLSASVSPDPRHHSYHHHQHQHHPTGCDEQQPDQSTNNMDEFSERFSISRTKSFWERLANSKKSPTGSGSGGEHQQQYNSSVRSLTSSGHGGGPNLVAVDTKSSQGSLMLNDLKQSPTGGADQHSPARYPAAMKSAFDRMDSTGGSGNSHYSGCSSTSSASDADEGQVNGGTTTAGYGRLQAKRSVAAGLGRPKASAPAAAGQLPAIGQLIRQDELNRSDRFRQTR